jgi:hypothetical protein
VGELSKNNKYVFLVTCAVGWFQYCTSIFLPPTPTPPLFDRVSSGLLFIIIGFVPDITTLKTHEQITEGDMSTKDQRNKQEAEKDCLLEGLHY